MTSDQIHKLFRKALKAHDLSDSGGFSQSDIAEQMELLKQYQGRNQTVVDKKKPKLMDSKTLKLFRDRFNGLYVFPCNKCQKGLMALNSQKCLGCGSISYFYDPDQ